MNRLISTALPIFLLIAIDVKFVAGAEPAEGSPAQIEGAFGFSLGDVVKLSSEKRSDNIYEITPNKPVDGFTTYTISITPKTQQVWCISCRGYFSTNAAARQKFNEIDAILTAKYGKAIKIHESEKHITQGSRKIKYSWTDFFGTKCVIHYIDEKLSNLAYTEANEPKKQDDSGL